MPDGKARPRPRTASDRPERLGGACPGRRVLKTANLQGKSGDGGFDRCENIAENGIAEPITPSLPAVLRTPCVRGRLRTGSARGTIASPRGQPGSGEGGVMCASLAVA